MDNAGVSIPASRGAVAGEVGARGTSPEELAASGSLGSAFIITVSSVAT
ncbi:MAG: hypothetical protein ACYC1I_01985 [Acidimicrobiales bacterium]